MSKTTSTEDTLKFSPTDGMVPFTALFANWAPFHLQTTVWAPDINEVHAALSHWPVQGGLGARLVEARLQTGEECGGSIPQVMRRVRLCSWLLTSGEFDFRSCLRLFWLDSFTQEFTAPCWRRNNTRAQLRNSSDTETKRSIATVTAKRRQSRWHSTTRISSKRTNITTIAHNPTPTRNKSASACLLE